MLDIIPYNKIQSLKIKKSNGWSVEKMPYVFTTSLFPPDKSQQLAEINVEGLKEFRAVARGLAKEIISNAVKATTNGIEVIGVWDIKEGKLEEFLLHQQKEMTRYHEVEGFSYSIDVRFKIVEALEMLGMKYPDKE